MSYARNFSWGRISSATSRRTTRDVGFKTRNPHTRLVTPKRKLGTRGHTAYVGRRNFISFRVVSSGPEVGPAVRPECLNTLFHGFCRLPELRSLPVAISWSACVRTRRFLQKGSKINLHRIRSRQELTSCRSLPTPFYNYAVAVT
jgi:hypothetical protein